MLQRIQRMVSRHTDFLCIFLSPRYFLSLYLFLIITIWRKYVHLAHGRVHCNRHYVRKQCLITHASSEVELLFVSDCFGS